MRKFTERLLSLCLAIVLLGGYAVMAAESTAGDNSYDPYPIEARFELDEAVLNPAAQIWGTDMFIAHSRGIKIVDLQTGQTTTNWTLDSTILPGMSRFVPKQLFVDDRYIIASQNGMVAVFENNGQFEAGPPKLIRRFGTTTMDEVKKIYADESFLYIFNTIKTKIVEGWKIPLDKLESLPNSGSSKNKYTVLNNRSKDYAYLSLGRLYDHVWSDIEISGNMAYIPVFNAEISAPYKTLMLVAINLEQFSDKGMYINFIAGGGINALRTTFITGKITERDIRENMKVYLKDMPENQLPLDTDTMTRKNLRFGIVDIMADVSLVSMYFTDFSALADMFGVAQEQLLTEEKVVAITIDGQEYEFQLEQHSPWNFTDGSLIVSGGQVYMLTDSDKDEFLLAADIEQGICKNIKVFGLFAETGSAGNKISGFNGAVLCDGMILGFMRGLDNSLFGIDTARIQDNTYDGSYQIRQFTGVGLYVGNPYADLIAYNGGVYYISSDGSKIIKLRAGEPVESVNLRQNGNTLPIVLFGGGAGDTVSVSVDGTEINVPVQNNLWKLKISSQANGQHKAFAGKELIYSVDAKPPIEITQIQAGDNLHLQITNNLREYGCSCDKIGIGINKYTDDGKVESAEAEVEAADGIASPVDIAVNSAGARYYELFLFGKGSTTVPVIKYVYRDGVLSAEKQHMVYGDVSQLTIESVRPDHINRVARISGQVQGGGRRMIMARVENGENVGFISGLSTENGEFILDFPYFSGTASIEDQYMVTVFAEFCDKNEIKEFYVIDEQAVNALVEDAKAAVMDAESLKLYLAEKPEFAQLIQVDLKAPEYTQLSDKNKIGILEKVVELIKTDAIRQIPEVFRTKCMELANAQTKEEALRELSAAKANTLTGFLRKYKELFGIPEELWSKYEALKDKMENANIIFLENLDISNPDNIAYVLKDAVEKANNAPAQPTKRPNKGSGGGGGGYFVSDPKPTIPPVDPDIKPGGEQNPHFVDLDGFAWAEESINALARENIISGIGENRFAPSSNVKREEFIKMLVCAAGLTGEAKTTFTDVQPENWFYPYVALGEKAGFIKGKDGKFGVGENISREDMAVFVYRAAVTLNIELDGNKQDFVDAGQIAGYAREAVEAVSAAGIMNGMGEQVFAPKETCNRAMAARVIFGLTELMDNNQEEAV